MIAYRSLATWRGEGTFGAWLSRIAVRLALRAPGAAQAGRLARPGRRRERARRPRATPSWAGATLRIPRHTLLRSSATPSCGRGRRARRAVSRGGRAALLRGSLARTRSPRRRVGRSAPSRPTSIEAWPGCGGSSRRARHERRSPRRPRDPLRARRAARGRRRGPTSWTRRSASGASSRTSRSATAVRARAEFTDRVMAAIEAEPRAGAGHRRRQRARAGALGGVLAAIRDSFRVAFGGGFPMAARAQALALVMVVVLAAGGTGIVAARAVGLLDDRGTPPPSPSPSLPEPTTSPVAEPLRVDATALADAVHLDRADGLPGAVGDARGIRDATPDGHGRPWRRTGRRLRTGGGSARPGSGGSGSGSSGSGPGRGPGAAAPAVVTTARPPPTTTAAASHAATHRHPEADGRRQQRARLSGYARRRDRGPRLPGLARR